MLRITKETFSLRQFFSCPYRKFPGKVGVLRKRSTHHHTVGRKSISSPTHMDSSRRATGAVGPTRQSERSQAPPSVNVWPTRVSCNCLAGLIIGPHHPRPHPGVYRRALSTPTRAPDGRRRAVAARPARLARRPRMNPRGQPIRHPQEKVAGCGDQPLCGSRSWQIYRPVTDADFAHHDQNLGLATKLRKY